MRKYSQKNNDSTTLVTFDVKSLRFSKGFVLESIKIILENDNCTFNDEFYRQISGTAMGTIFAPTHATLTMGYFEVHFYHNCEVKWEKEF